MYRCLCRTWSPKAERGEESWGEKASERGMEKERERKQCAYRFRSRLSYGDNVLNAIGSVVLFDSKCDLSEIYSSKLRFMADESCKQCVPCRDGSEILYKAFEELRTKGKTAYSMAALNILSESAYRSSICRHGKSLDALFKAACNHIKGLKSRKV